jgi:hypothetical protein
MLRLRRVQHDIEDDTARHPDDDEQARRREQGQR